MNTFFYYFILFISEKEPHLMLSKHKQATTLTTNKHLTEILIKSKNLHDQ